MCSAPVLMYPKFDREFILQTDASDTGLGVALSQLDNNGLERPVAYASKVLSPRERKYCTTEKEAFAVVFGVRTFRIYLLGRPFTVITDHSALKWLHTIDLKGRLARWVMDLQEFQFSVVHKPGRLHNNADALSCLLIPHKREALTAFENVRIGPSSEDIAQENDNCAITVNPTLNIKQAQQEDPIIAKIMEFKTSGKPRPEFAAWCRDTRLKAFWYHFDRMFIRNGLLYRSFKAKNPHPDPVVVVPKILEAEILKGTHDSPFSGHLGVSRTLERIRRRFFWPRMRESVEEYIHQCDTCMQRKLPANKNKAPLKNIEVSEPFTFWAIDYMGPLPETAWGNWHILVAMDHFTKWCEAFPTKDQKATTVVKILVEKVFSRFGPPVVLHSDQGANFESNLMHELCDVMGITKTRTTAYHPRCDGHVERQNRTLQDMLAAFSSKHGSDWDLWLDSVVFTYNTSRQESLRISPYEVVFGRTPRIPLELELGLPLRDPSTQSEYVQSIRKVFREVRQVARENLEEARDTQRKRNEEKAQAWCPFVQGETVYLRRPKGWKFGANWVGPFDVVSRLGVDYKIKSTKGKVMVVHHDQLKRGYAPVGSGKVVCPARETGDTQVVYNDHTTDNEPLRDNAPLPQRVRPRNLRQNIQPPNRYGSSAT